VSPLTEKDLRKLNRYQLLELLVAQTERADKLQAELEAAQLAMKAQELKIATLGSIAEASLQLSGVFEAAQKAADLYIDGAKKYALEIEEAAYEQADQIMKKARKQAQGKQGE
jgi:hypothetical protein